MQPDTSLPAWGRAAGSRAGRCSGSAGSTRQAAARHGRSGCTTGCWHRRSNRPCCRCLAANNTATRPVPTRRNAARTLVRARMSRTPRPGWRRSGRTRQYRFESAQHRQHSRQADIQKSSRQSADRTKVADALNLADPDLCANPAQRRTAATVGNDVLQHAAAFLTASAVAPHHPIAAAGVDHHAAGLAGGQAVQLCHQFGKVQGALFAQIP